MEEGSLEVLSADILVANEVEGHMVGQEGQVDRQDIQVEIQVDGHCLDWEDKLDAAMDEGMEMKEHLVAGCY